MKVYQLLSKHQKWCKKYYAVDNLGKSVDYQSDKAVRYCLLGAIKKCYSTDLVNKVCKKFISINKLQTTISFFNDASNWRTVYQSTKRANI